MTDKLEEIKKRLQAHALLELELPKANQDSIIAIEQLVIIQENYYSDASALLEEIESLRSQLQQAEQEREDWKEKALDTYSELDLVKEDLFYEKRSNEENHSKYVQQYHTAAAMREELEWYADEDNHENVDQYGERIKSNVYDDAGERARTVLSRYPKEGVEPCQK